MARAVTHKPGNGELGITRNSKICPEGCVLRGKSQKKKKKTINVHRTCLVKSVNAEDPIGKIPPKYASPKAGKLCEISGPS